MALVEYSDSSDDDANIGRVESTESKKRKLPTTIDHKAPVQTSLPPLPTTFHDLYSSTVRTSTQDDPSLHGGRKRVKPHVQGNWPTHVYLEWHPTPEESQRLQSFLGDTSKAESDYRREGGLGIHSLLTNDLSVPLPLHVSLSRPLTLKTTQKDEFPRQIESAVATSLVSCFTCRVKGLSWHPNEMRTRWFLVLALEDTREGDLGRLLKASNSVAKGLGLELLYADDVKTNVEETTVEGDSQGKFHVSIGWALEDPKVKEPDVRVDEVIGSLDFKEVKVRTGQDVSVIHLPERRSASSKG